MLGFAGQRPVFFFSSRRRHTRWPRDWSSDVCSSDLGPVLVTVRRWRGLAIAAQDVLELLDRGDEARSEERRVGKECRTGRWPQHEKKRKNEEVREDDEGRSKQTKDESTENGYA